MLMFQICMLLWGPPGTGKTMLAKAVAHHTTAAFIRVVGSEFVQKYLGEVCCFLYLYPRSACCYHESPRHGEDHAGQSAGPSHHSGLYLRSRL